MLKGKSIVRKIFIIGSFLAFIGCASVLIVEAATDGESSAKKSSAIGQTSADIINNIAGDTSAIIDLKSIKIKNPIDVAYIGDTYQLEIELAPENASFKSYNFKSSNTDVASISEAGYITFLNEGSSQITVTSNKYPELSDNFIVNVNPVLVESITSTLIGTYELNDDIYTIEIGKTYSISTTILPSNATDKALTYSIDRDDFIKINNNSITPINESNGEITTITIKSSNELKNEFKIVVKPIEIQEEIIYDLEKISFNATSYTLSKYETKSFSTSYIIFTPTNATYKGYKLTSSDTSIASISGTTLIANKPGNCTLTVTSTTYPSISATTSIVVKETPVTNYSLLVSGKSTNVELVEGTTSSVTISSISPSNSTYRYANSSQKANYIRFVSSDSNIIKINNATTGSFTCANVGTATVTATLQNYGEDGTTETNTIVKSISIKVNPIPPEIPVTDYELNGDLISNFNEDATKEHTENLIYTNKNYSLNNYFKISKLLNGEEDVTNTANVSTSLKYSLIEATPDTIDFSSFISGSTLNIQTAGSYTLQISHDATGVSKTISFIAIHRILNVNENNVSRLANKKEAKTEFNEKEYEILNTFSLYLGKQRYYSLNYDTDEEFESYFSFNIIQDNTTSIATFTKNSDREFAIIGLKEGITKILITPIYDGLSFESLSKVIVININHIYINDFAINLSKTIKKNDDEYDYEEKEIEYNDELDEYYSQAFVNERYYLSYIFNNEDLEYQPTSYQMIISSSDTDICSINNSNSQIYFRNSGKVTITIKDRITEKSKQIIFISRNITEFNSDNMYTIDSTKSVEFDESTSTFHIYNLTSAKITLHYLPTSTYKNANYSVDNEEILNVDNSGNVEALNIGTANVIIIINDGYSIDITINIKFVVDPTPFIDDLRNFFQAIRKAIGHFGAFLATGIFSTLFVCLMFDKKYWVFSHSINYILGFSLASLTEIIQLYTPGRYGCMFDVWIDYTGFVSSTTLIILIFLTIYLIQHLQNNKKLKIETNNNDNNIMDIEPQNEPQSKNIEDQNNKEKRNE